MKKKFVAVMLGMLVGSASHAAGPPVPHSFTAGQKAVASEVNENFQNLADRIDDLTQTVDQKANTADVNNSIQTLNNRIDALPGAAVFDASDYRIADTINVKTFAVSDSGCATQEVNTYVRNTSPGKITIVETTVASNGSPCFERVITSEVEAGISRIASLEFVSPNPNVQTFTPKLLAFPAQMSIGAPWSGETVLTNTVFTPTTSLLAVKYDIVGVESVTVPAGTFNNCLKFFRTSITSSTTVRVQWRCPGLGLVKEFSTTGDGNRELVSTSP